MSRVSLLPRLSSLGVDTILRTSGAGGPAPLSWPDCHDKYAMFLSFGATGGSTNHNCALQISDSLRGIASECGFPGKSSADGRGHFDRLAAIALASEPELKSGEALRDDVWAFLTTVLTPDVVAWRFPDIAPSRFAGGVRNTFQRLWTRGVTLDRGKGQENRWFLVQMLSEDAMVQIFERASIAGNQRLAKALAEEWVKLAKKVGRGAMEDVMRRATKLVRLRNEIIDLSFLDDKTLEAEIKSAFSLAAGRHTDID